MFLTELNIFIHIIHIMIKERVFIIFKIKLNLIAKQSSKYDIILKFKFKGLKVNLKI